MSKKIVLVAVCFMMVLLPLVSAGLVDWFNGITGRAASPQPTNVSISVTGANPASIEYVSPIGATTPIENNIATITFFVTMTDQDGVADLNQTAMNANLSKSGQTSRINSSCAYVGNINATAGNFTCSVEMWYWDGNGAWSVNVTGKDLGNLTYQSNTSTSFTYNELKAMVLSPTALTWPAISSGAVNQTSNNDPTLINNTGNYDGTVSVNAMSLLGEIDPTNIIYAENFTIGPFTDTGNPYPECNGSATAMVNNTGTSVTGSASNPGNISAGAGAGQEELYYCIPNVPAVLSSQTYSTTQGGSWTVIY